MKLRPIGHEERLSIVDHLDELRSRVFVCLGALIVAFGLCFWQNGPLLNVLNRALPHASSVSGSSSLGSVPNRSVRQRHGFLQIERGAAAIAASELLLPKTRTASRKMAQGARQAASSLPTRASSPEKPIATGTA